MTQNLTIFYLGQAEVYASEGSGKLIPIADMHWRHALNAAKKMLREASTIAQDAGRSNIDWTDAQIWLTTTPLFRALSERAR